jgi:catechol 2,3-dioxygenase-like lactoylglutathione lyase family enzyme
VKILGHRHTGIIVNDFDKMLAFYLGLGLTLKSQAVEEGPFVNGLIGTEGITLRTAKLVLENEELAIQHKFNLELMKIVSHEAANRQRP